MKGKKAKLAAARALATKNRKRLAIGFPVGSSVRVRRDAPVRTLNPLSTRAYTKYAGLSGTVTGVNADDGEVKVKIPGRIEGWFISSDIEHKLTETELESEFVEDDFEEE